MGASPVGRVHWSRLELGWSETMGGVKAIEKAVESLPAAELAEVRRWFAEFYVAARRYRSSACSPVCFAMRASMRGPISSPS